MATNVLFKKGSRANLVTLQSQNKLVDGAIYITTDEGGIYLGQSANTLKRLGDFVTVANETELNSVKNADKNALYLVNSGNQLCRWDPQGGTAHTGGWVQLNKPADITDVIETYTLTATASDDVATITNSMSQSGTEVARQIKIAAAGSNTITSSDSEVGGNSVSTITITGTDNDTVSALSSNLDGSNKLNITLTNTPKVNGTAGAAAEAGKLSIGGGAGIAISKDADGQYSVAVDGSSADLSSTTDTGNLKLILKDVSGTEHGTTVPTKITYGKKTGTTASTTADYTATGWNLDVYTQAEVDAIMKANNAMTFRGVISQQSDIPTTGVHVGDTYKVAVSKEYTYNSQETGASATTLMSIGDMLIALGTESDSGEITSNTLQWVYIPSGNDDQTAYSVSAANGAFTFNAGSEEMGGITNGDLISVVKNTDKVAKISHNKLAAQYSDTVADANKKTVSGNENATFTYIESENVDEYGHLLSSTRKTITINGNQVNEVKVEAGAVTGGALIGTTIKQAAGDDAESGFEFTSSTLEITPTASTTTTRAKVDVELAWGEF